MGKNHQHLSTIGDPHGRLVGDPQNVIGDPQIFIEDPDLFLEDPHVIMRP